METTFVPKVQKGQENLSPGSLNCTLIRIVWKLRTAEPTCASVAPESETRQEDEQLEPEKQPQDHFPFLLPIVAR